MRNYNIFRYYFFLIFSNSSISQNKHNGFNHLNNLDIAFYFESGNFDIFLEKTLIGKCILNISLEKINDFKKEYSKI